MLTLTLSGPQGSGKTTLATNLTNALRNWGYRAELRDDEETVSVWEGNGAAVRVQVQSDAPARPTPGFDLTLRELQTNLPWTIRYSADFRANPQPHKDFAHALIHVGKASGKLFALIDDMDHRKETADNPAIRDFVPYLADLVVCALRAANTFPGGVVDLQRAVEKRLETKNGVKLPRRGG